MISVRKRGITLKSYFAWFYKLLIDKLMGDAQRYLILYIFFIIKKIPTINSTQSTSLCAWKTTLFCNLLGLEVGPSTSAFATVLTKTKHYIHF